MVEKTLGTLKHRARLLHRAAAGGDPAAISRLRAWGVDTTSPTTRGRCLGAVARELGFRGWPHLTRVLRGEAQDDFGTLLYPAGASAHWNIWSAHYPEAAAIRAEHGGYLLAYKRQYFIADADYIDTLGLDPLAEHWRAIGRDWVRPGDLNARADLYAQRIAAHYRQAGGQESSC